MFSSIPGLQHGVIHADTPYGLQLNVCKMIRWVIFIQCSIAQAKLLPQYLSSLGFSSHIVGKWHLGHHTQAHTPTFRGFHSHTGYWLGKEDYYDHSDDNGKPVHFIITSFPVNI